MSFEIMFVLGLLGFALVLFVTEIVRMDVVALLVLSILALSGFVDASEAVSGFSNAAVITVWAMFIISEGLSRAGVADLIGRTVLRIAGHGEVRMIVVVMLTAGILSGFMNNIGVAALMLPVIVGIAARSNLPAPRLLMPLAYGSLLGGLTTLVGTPPNLLVSGALADAGLRPFSLFDFTPIGVVILATGTAFVALVGRHLLPSATASKTGIEAGAALRDLYRLNERMFMVRVPAGSIAVGRTIDQIGLSRSAGLVIISLLRDGTTLSLPHPTTALRADDLMVVEGRQDRFEDLRKWSSLKIERESPVLQEFLSQRIELRELRLAAGSTLVGAPLHHGDFRERFRANVLAVRRAGTVWRTRLGELALEAGDRLLVQCDARAISGLETAREFDALAPVSDEERVALYAIDERAFVIHVPQDSVFAGRTMSESRLGDAFDFRLLGVFRAGEMLVMPASDEKIAAADLLIVQGRPEDVAVLRGLQELDIQYDASAHLDVFDSDALRMVEATLHPHSSLVGMTVAELELREAYQLELVAIWRNGKPQRSGLAGVALRSGDALLLVGPRARLAALNSNPDFIVVTPVAATTVETAKAPLAGAIVLAIVAAVLAGWQPISVAAVAGATLMVLTRCLTMEQAYRAIDWRSIFLIAGMLPLGIAMQRTGAAQFVADGAMALLGDYGPWPVIAGLYGVTAIATMVVPTAALVLLMAPIVLSASAELGISPHTAMMAVAIAASASFTSPISHPANVLVMGPGGYRFSDYLKLGVPLTLVVFLVTALLLPWLWPLR